MIHNLNNFVNESLGSSLTFSAHGWWGKEKNLSAEKFVRPKVLGAKPKQAGKKEGGWGKEFLPACFRPRSVRAKEKRKGVWGNSAFPLRNQIEASPATCLNTWKAEHHRKILFSLRKKEIRRAKMKRAKSIFLWCGELCRAVAGLASLLGFCSKNVRTSIKKHRQFSLFAKS